MRQLNVEPQMTVERQWRTRRKGRGKVEAGEEGEEEDNPRILLLYSLILIMHQETEQPVTPKDFNTCYWWM